MTATDLDIAPCRSINSSPFPSFVELPLASPFVEDPFERQRFDLITTLMSQYYVFTIQRPSIKNDAAQPGGCLTPAVKGWALRAAGQGLRRARRRAAQLKRMWVR